jgi:hypothetical protein
MAIRCNVETNTMKPILVILSIFMYVDFYSQTKKDPLTLTKFSVSKTGKTMVKYSYYESPGVKYKIESKNTNGSWTMLNESSQYPMVANENGKIVNKTDTFTLNLDKGVKQIRIIFIEPKSSSLVTETATIP